MELSDAARDIRNALSDPRRLVQLLGLDKGAKPQAGGAIVCCPSHNERDASCSVTRGPDGTVRVRCFACDFSADAIGLIAQVHGLSTRGEQFRDVLVIGAELAGLLALAHDLRDESDAPRAPRRPVPPPAPLPVAEYPDRSEVEALWGACMPVASDQACSGALVARLLDPVEVSLRDLARALPRGANAPQWARYGGRSWFSTGHRMLLRVYDHRGECRSVRSWRVVDGESPKRLPPAGCRSSGLVLANLLAVGMLRRQLCPLDLCIVEGEPDFLVACTSWRPGVAVIGIGSGSWNEDFARAVPRGTRVVVATHNDPAGDRYAEAVIASLGEGRQLWRWRNAS